MINSSGDKMSEEPSESAVEPENKRRCQGRMVMSWKSRVCDRIAHRLGVEVCLRCGKESSDGYSAPVLYPHAPFHFGPSPS